MSFSVANNDTVDSHFAICTMCECVEMLVVRTSALKLYECIIAARPYYSCMTVLAVAIFYLTLLSPYRCAKAVSVL